MYNLKTIQSKFFTDKLITFKSSLNNISNVLDSEITGVSKSNRYFNSGVHPLITLENIEAFIPTLSSYTIAAYSAGTTYGNYNLTFALSDVVSSNSKYYISIATGNLGKAVTNMLYWKETTLLALVLREKIKSSIEVVMSNLITPNFIEDNVSMFRIGNATNDVIENTSKLVGFRIVSVSSNHLLFIINQIATFFEGIETINLKLYNQNKLVSSFSLTTTANLFEWQDITQLEITSNTGAWYLFYDQDDLSGRAIGNNVMFYNYMSDHANITPFQMDSVSDLPNISTSNFVFDKNFGLNLNFSVSYDLTNFIIQHLLQFAECIQKQFEYDTLQMFVYNPDAEICRNQRNMNSESLMYELKSFEGDTSIKKLSACYKQLKATIQKLGIKDTAFDNNEKDYFTVSSI